MILIALGANLPSQAGPPATTLRAALDRLAQNGAAPLMVSHLYRTPAWPDPRDPEFVNGVASIATELSAEKLMELLHDTEDAFGRRRTVRNAPRTLDLDLLDYNGAVEQAGPILPHPRIADRAFVLIPLREIAPDWRDPASGKGIDELIATLPFAERGAIQRIG